MINLKKVPKYPLSALTVLASTLAGAALAADVQFADSVNSGLATAFNSVGQNLFGSAVFNAQWPVDPCRPTDPCIPGNPVRLNFAANSHLSTHMNISYPIDPCHTFLQVSVTPAGNDLPARVSLLYDPAYAPAGFNPVLIAAPEQLALQQPNTTQCPAAETKGSGGGVKFADKVNSGLVTALNSVGQNLFGSAVFNVQHPVDPAIPGDPLRLFYAANSHVPAQFNVFIPPNPVFPVDPCHTFLQVSVTPAGTDLPARVELLYDPSYAPGGFNPVVTAAPAALAQETPITSQCPAASTSAGG